MIPHIWRQKIAETGVPEKQPEPDETPQPIPAPDHKRRIADYAANVERQRDLVRKTRGE